MGPADFDTVSEWLARRLFKGAVHVAMNPERLIELIATAGRLVGLKELMRAGNVNPGEKKEVERILRELVRSGDVQRDGKRFGIPGAKITQKSGPAWQSKDARSSTPARGENKKTDSRPGGYALFKQQAEEKKSQSHQHKAKGGREEHQPRGARAPVVKESIKKVETFVEKQHREKKGEIAKKSNTVEGIIHHHRDGFAFVKLLVGKAEDVFVPPEDARKALDGDRVILEMVRGRDGRSAGRILDVVGRTRQLVIGVYQESKNEAWVEPREAQLGRILVPKTQLARPGDNVKVKLGIGEGVIGKHDELFGEVAGSLGSAADHSVEVLSIAYGKGFSDEFPDDVMREADGITLQVSDDEAKEEGRRDLRKMGLVTIDGEDARDFDDAIYVEDRPSGWRLVVAIADVSHYVREGTALDDEALKRATSVYMPGRVLPMLPERLSNGICSLKPDEDRLCMVADMQIDKSGRTTATEIYPAVMKSAARCTYTEVHDVLNGENVPHRNAFKPLFTKANTLAGVLRQMRRDRGAIDFELPETRVELKEDGLPKQLVRRDRWESHKLVEECMLAANEAVARFFRESDLPTVNRFHGEPDEEKLGVFVQLLRAYGINAPSHQLSSSELNQVLKQLEGHAEQRALNQLALRSMMQAVYSSAEAGHYGLGATDYLHFTSPIRRYPDLLVHRLLKANWARKHSKKSLNAEHETERLEAMAAQSSERERAAMMVEREVNSLYSCLLVKDRIGEVFPATITGLSEHGFFAELDGLWVDGFVKGESIGPDFELDQATYRLVFGGGFEVRVGQKIEVKLISVNMSRKQIEYEVESWLDAMEAPEKRKPRAAGMPAPDNRRGPKSFGRGGGDRKSDSRFEKRDTRGGGKPAFGDRKDSSRGGGKPAFGDRKDASRGGGKPGFGDRSKGPSQKSHSSSAAPGKFSRQSAGGKDRYSLDSRIQRSERAPDPAVTRPDNFRHPTRDAATGADVEPPRAFDARATLDRLWKTKVASPGEARRSESGRQPPPRDNDPYAKPDRNGRGGGSSGGGRGGSGRRR